MAQLLANRDRLSAVMLSSSLGVQVQRTAGNRAGAQLLANHDRLSAQMLSSSLGVQVQRTEDDDEKARDRRRQSRPRDAPRGTRPIDETDLDRETIHGIKDGIGAGPKDWVGVTPDGDVITTDGDGNAENHGPVSSFTVSLRERIANKLKELGIPPWLVAATVVLIIAALADPEPFTKIAAIIGAAAAVVLCVAIGLGHLVPSGGQTASADDVSQTDGASGVQNPAAMAQAAVDNSQQNGGIGTGPDGATTDSDSDRQVELV